MLTLTLVGPTISATRERLRRQAETTAKPANETAQAPLAEWRERLDELVQDSRERATQQIQYLRAQSRQLQAQSRQLSKAIRKEARQRKKLMKRARKAGVDWSQEMRKRGEQLGSEALERGQELSQELVERGQELSHDLAKRGRKLSRNLAKRSRKATRRLARRREELFEPARGRGRVWAFIGFGIGMLVAGAITYRLMRRRTALLEVEEEVIEITPLPSMNGSVDNSNEPVETTPPAGETYTSEEEIRQQG